MHDRKRQSVCVRECMCMCVLLYNRETQYHCLCMHMGVSILHLVSFERSFALCNCVPVCACA